MSIYEKKGKYYCRFQINGERHHYKCNGATSIKEAQKIENQYIYKVQQQQNGVIPKEEKKVKLKELLFLYDNYSRINKLSYGKDSFVKVIGGYFGTETYLDKISVQKIELFKQWLKDEKGYSDETVNKYRAALSKMFNLGIDNKLIKENPVKSVKAFRAKNYKVRFLTKEEEDRMYKVINTGVKVVGRDRQEKIIYPYKRIEDLITTALQTGMRKGEIFKLKWFNVNFEYRYIDILESKSGKARRVPLTDKLIKVLKSIRKTSEYVFVNPETNEPYNNITISFKNLMEKANIQNFRFHDFRHTVATRLVDKGVPLPVVKELLGHSKIETTMRYVHTTETQKLEAIEVLNSYNYYLIQFHKWT